MVGLALARVLAQLGMHDRALAQLNTIVGRNPDDLQGRIARGRHFAEQGDQRSADTDFHRAAVLAGDDLSGFIEAGWWVVGPYPEEMGRVCPPELDPDPAHPALDDNGSGVLRWRPVATGRGGLVSLKQIFASDHISAYALAYVDAPRERTALLHVGGSGKVRIWLNGQFVHETAAAVARWHLDPVPVTLRAGRNTLLAKATAADGTHDLYVRLGDDPIDRGNALAEMALWPEAAALYARQMSQGPPEDPEFHRRLAILLLAAGDREGYQRAAAEMIGRFSKTALPALAGFVAEICALSPDSVVDEGRLKKIAALALERHKQQRPGAWGLAIDALLHCRLGQPERAIARLAKQADGDQQPLVWTVLALAHHLRGSTQDARTSLEKADQWYDRVTKDLVAGTARPLPDHPQWWRLAAFQVARREAKALIEGADPGDPNLDALHARARRELQRRDLDTADYDRALVLSPDDPMPCFARARRLAELRRWHEAEADIARAIGKRPGDAQIRRLRNRIFIERGRVDELVPEYAERLEGTDDGPSNQLSPRNVLAWEVAEWDEVFTRLVQKRPDLTSLWIGRGRWHAGQNRWKESAADYGRVIRSRAPGIEWFEYAGVLTLAGDVSGARDFVAWAVERAGSPVEPYAAFLLARTVGTIPDLAADSTQALGWTDQAVARTMPPWYVHALGLALYRAGRYSEAIERLEESDAAWSDIHGKTQNRVVLAMGQARLGALAKAQEQLTRANALIPRSGIDMLATDWIGIQLLRREAEVLIPIGSAPAKATGDD
jgi:tetratricopeptide (TPR) repeat protein